MTAVGFLDKFKKRKKYKNARMEVVYASPEVMSREVYASPRPVSSENNPIAGKYPSMHYAKRQKVFCLYCGGRLKSQSQICSVCEKDNSKMLDPDATLQLCSNCDAGIPFLASYCSFCGRKI